MVSTLVLVLLITCSCVFILSTAHPDKKQPDKEHPETAYYYPRARRQGAPYYYPPARGQAAAHNYPPAREQVAPYKFPPARERVHVNEAYYPEEAKEASLWTCYSIIGCQGTAVQVNGITDCCNSKEWPSYSFGNDNKCHTCGGCSGDYCWKRCGCQDDWCWLGDDVTCSANHECDTDKPCGAGYNCS